VELEVTCDLTLNLLRKFQKGAFDLALVKREPTEQLEGMGPVSNFVREVGLIHQRVNLLPKITANWILASVHSRGGRFHSSAA